MDAANFDKENCVYEKITSAFKSDLIKEVLKLHYMNSKTKLNEEALELLREILRILVIETAIRSAKCASLENRAVITLDHIESVLPQIMLDFPL